MVTVNVRLASVVLDNFMNVVHGKLVLNSSESMRDPSILGHFWSKWIWENSVNSSLSCFEGLVDGTAFARRMVWVPERGG